MTTLDDLYTGLPAAWRVDVMYLASDDEMTVIVHVRDKHFHLSVDSTFKNSSLIGNETSEEIISLLYKIRKLLPHLIR